MAFRTAFNTILTRFKDRLDSVRPNVPVAWPNIEFDPSVSFNPSSHQAWARITVLGGEQNQVSINGASPRWRQVGVITVQVFTPTEEGSEMGLAVADDIATIFRGVTVSGVVLQAGSVIPLGRTNEEPYYQVNVEVPFRYDS